MHRVTVDGKAMQDYELCCPDCGDSMALMKDRNFVGYRCRSLDCRGSHASHPDGSPVGTPADARTRKARTLAHEAFDRVWRTKKMTRGRAYAWMRNELGMTEEECHIGSFDVETCRRLVQKVRGYYPDLFPFDPLL
jgi:hypothetical protein